MSDVTLAAALAERCKNELVVAIDEEYGYRLWLWFPGLSPESLEDWWRRLEDVETFWTTDREDWPGDIYETDQIGELFDLWMEQWENAPYIAPIDTNYQTDMEDPDTYLQRRGGAPILHQGAYSD